MTVTRTHVFARRRNSNLSHNRRVARPAVDDDDELKTPTITKKTTLKITTMPKHSSFPMIPASAPTSPAVTRKSDRNPPATPLRSLPPQLSDTFNCLIPPLQPYRHPTRQYLRRRMVQGSVFSPRSLYARKLDELDNSNFFSNGKGAILHDDDYHSASSESSRSTLDS